MMDILSIINLALTVALAAGGVFAFRAGFSKTAGEIQDRVISALKTEIDTLRSKVDDMEQENIRMDQVISTMIEALKKRGLNITVDGNLVTISDGQATTSTRIRGGV